MGPHPARRKRAGIGQTQLAEGLIPGPAIPPRLINLVEFDKETPPAVWPLLTIATAKRADLGFCAAKPVFAGTDLPVVQRRAANLGAQSQPR
jgi:hypothetical protein